MTQPTGKEYEIRTLDDLIQLDERQLEACLKDIKTWVRFRKDLNAKVDVGRGLLRKMGMTDEQINDSIVIQDHMLWLDDGEEGGEVNLEILTENKEKVAEFTLDVDGDGKVSHG